MFVDDLMDRSSSHTKIVHNPYLVFRHGHTEPDLAIFLPDRHFVLQRHRSFHFILVFLPRCEVVVSFFDLVKALNVS